MLRRTSLLVVFTLLVCLPAFGQDVPAQPVNAAVTAGGFTYKFGFDYMLQVSGRRDYPFRDQQYRDDETFAWWRLRPRVTGTSRRVDFVLEGQDTHAAGGSFSSRKAWLDILNAHVTVKDMRGWSVKAGRHVDDFDVLDRMIRTPDFAAILRSFDVAEVGWRQADARRGRATDLRVFALRVVDNLPTSFNKQKPGEFLWTLYGRRDFAPRASLQSYVMARHNREMLSESGVPGRGVVYAWQTEVSGPTPLSWLDWTAESVLERGHVSTDDVRAWGMFLRTQARLPGGHTLDARYFVTSGDDARGDGVRGAYDPFYGASSNFGSLGQVRGINVRSLSIGGGWLLSKPLTLNWRYYNTRLNNANDLWYGAVIPNISRPDAASFLMGHETNLMLTYRMHPRLMLRTAYHRFYPGGYVADTPRNDPHEYRLQIIGRL